MRKELFASLLVAMACAAVPVAANAEPEPQQAGQQARALTGTVLDENNEPVIGATVNVKGNKKSATATDAFGNFSIQAPLAKRSRLAT